jgi:hypothetical protein
VGEHIRALVRRGIKMLPATAVTLLLLLPASGEGTAMPAPPRPFAPAGIYSTDFTGFRKWQGMIERFARQRADPPAPSHGVRSSTVWAAPIGRRCCAPSMPRLTPFRM